MRLVSEKKFTNGIRGPETLGNHGIPKTADYETFVLAFSISTLLKHATFSSFPLSSRKPQKIREMLIAQ